MNRQSRIPGEGKTGYERERRMITQTVILKIKDETLQRELENIIAAIPGYAVETNDGPCNLLIVEITDSNPEEQFDCIMGAMSSGMAGDVFLVSGAANPHVLVQALKTGPKEFFQLPLNHEEVKNALIKFQARSAGYGRGSANPVKEGTIIHVVGSKGGVGTTTIAVNLAMSLLVAHKTVALVDMNLLFGDIPTFLGMESPRPDWAKIARNISRLDSSFLPETLHRHPSGLHVLPSPTSIFEAFSGGSEIIRKLLRLMKTVFDYVVIDGGQGFNEMSKSILEVADEIMVVTLLNLPSLTNVTGLRETFRRLGCLCDDRVSIVANRAHKRSADISVEDAERIIKKKISWAVPNDFQNTMHAINTGKTLIEMAPGREITKEISEIAAFFLKEQIGEGNKGKRGLLSDRYARLVERYT